MRFGGLFNGNYIPTSINDYNGGRNGSRFNDAYASFMQARTMGLARYGGSLRRWLFTRDGAKAIWALLDCYGMNVRGSKLVSSGQLHATLQSLATIADVDQIVRFPIPTGGLNRVLPSGRILASSLGTLFKDMRLPNRITVSGGFVGASKALHCILPGLVPMLDRTHIALSLYEICRSDYLPPSGSWFQYLGSPAPSTPNPSPRGAGAQGWGSGQLLCAIGFYECIYEEWQTRNGQPGLQAFLALDSSRGTTGVPRIVDKIMW